MHGVLVLDKPPGMTSAAAVDHVKKRLGVKRFGGEQLIAGNIIVRQRGTQYHAGANVRMGRDHTLYAGVAGRVAFSVKGAKSRRMVSVLSD